MLHRAVLRVGVAGGATFIIAGFRDEVCHAVSYERIAFLFTVSVVDEGTYSCGIRHLRGLAEVVVGVGAGAGAVTVGCTQQQAAGGFIGVGFDFTSCIRFRQHAVVGIVGLTDVAAVGVCLGGFHAGGIVIAPNGDIFIGALAWGDANNCIRAAEGRQRSHAVGIIVAEAYRLQPCAPFGNLAATDIVAVAGGVTLRIRHRGGQVVCGVIDRGGHISGSIRDCERAPGGVCHRGGRVAEAIRLGVNHPAGRVAASGGSRYPGVIRLRERKAIHRHGFCGDVAGGQGVVALAFRSNMILYPLR